jgi:hypothetical protein
MARGTGWSDNGPGMGPGIALTCLVAFVALAEAFLRRCHGSLLFPLVLALLVVGLVVGGVTLGPRAGR